MQLLIILQFTVIYNKENLIILWKCKEFIIYFSYNRKNKP